MNELRPCERCRRHVRDVDPECPFCGAALPPALPPPRFAAGRFTRAAVFAGAAVIGASCGGAEPKPEGVAMQRPTATTPPITQTLTDPPERRPDAGPQIVDEPPDLEDWRRRRHRNNDSNLPMPYGAPPARDRLV